MKRNTVIVLLVAVFALVYFVVSIRHGSKDTPVCSNNPDAPVTLSAEARASKIMECAGCHKEEYGQEMIGPHSAAYRNLLEHKSNADTSKLFPKEYTRLVHRDFNVACVSCHCTENLYETVYAGLDTEKNETKMVVAYYPNMKAFPQPRKIENTRISGVDCLTCHKSGTSVVTRADYVQKGAITPPCNPIASKFFSSNNNCYSCHFVTNKSMVDNIHNPVLTASKSCNSCHAEYNSEGKFTHYYYWRHDAESKKKFPLLQLVFNDLKIAKANNNVYHLVWQNNQSPHGSSECAELFAIIHFMGANDNQISQEIVRLNNKTMHDPNLVSFFPDSIVPGQCGVNFSPTGEAIKKSFAIKGGNVQKIIIEGYDKAQYWIDDKAAVKVFTKEIKM